jgi:hypothetical protein
MAEDWRMAGVELCLDELSADSAENVGAACRWAAEVGASRLLVVSSWWHFRLLLYYRRDLRGAVSVRHVRAWRNDRVIAHLLHELRYLPRALRREAGGRAVTDRVAAATGGHECIQ